jgi:light-regulated signal transduction histidine kinase (bacteriophytochrome)
VLGKTDLEIFPTEVAANMFADDMHVLQSGYPVIDREEYFFENGQKKRWLLTSKIPLRNEQGQVTGLVGISYDITDRLEAEEKIRQLNAELEQRVLDRTAQLEAANQELESFSYSVSHDLRAPLRGIAGFSRILLEEYAGRLDAEGKRYLNIIQNDTRKMGKLIDDILALSRLGRKNLRCAGFRMENLARKVFKELQELEPVRKVELRIEALPPAWGDRDMMRQVMMNLLANAFKFTRGREDAVIQVSGWREGAENVYCVRDNGVGFEMEYAGKLFGVFQRLHSEEQFEGTGVGLAIVERIIHRHGGRVWGEGKPGEGAAFWFALPRTAEAEAEI